MEVYLPLHLRRLKPVPPTPHPGCSWSATTAPEAEQQIIVFSTIQAPERFEHLADFHIPRLLFLMEITFFSSIVTPIRLCYFMFLLFFRKSERFEKQWKTECHFRIKILAFLGSWGSPIHPFCSFTFAKTSLKHVPANKNTHFRNH